MFKIAVKTPKLLTEPETTYGITIFVI